MHKIERAGRKNFIGLLMRDYRKTYHFSTRKMSEFLKQNGLEWDKNAVNKTELGKRVVSDIELLELIRILQISENEIVKIWISLK